MKKLIRNTSDEQSAAFWADVERVAASVNDLPAWMKAGVDVNTQHFEGYDPHAPAMLPDRGVSRARNRK